MKGSFEKPLIVLLISFLFFAHLPFLNAALCGEEGLFAYAVEQVARGKTARFLLSREPDGTLHEQVAKHNLAGYVFPGIIYAAFYHTLGLADPTSAFYPHRGTLIRISIFLFYGAAILLAAAMIPAERRLWGTFLITSFAYFHLPFIASMQIQYDGAVSTFILVFVLFALLRGRTSAFPFRWFLTGAFILVLGKFEYVPVGVGMIAITAWILEKERRAKLWTGTVLGFALGGLVSLLYSAANFIGGFDMAGDIVAAAHPEGGIARKMAAIVSYFKNNFHWFKQPFLLLIVCAYFLYRSKIEGKKIHPVSLNAAAAALMIIIGYGLVAWEGDGFPRYFAPAFVLAPLALSVLPLGEVNLSQRWPPVQMFLTVLLCVTTLVGISQRRDNPQNIFCRVLKEENPLPWLKANGHKTFTKVLPGPSSFGFYSPTIPFICCGWGPDIDKDSMIPVNKSP